MAGQSAANPRRAPPARGHPKLRKGFLVQPAKRTRTDKESRDEPKAPATPPPQPDQLLADIERLVADGGMRAGDVLGWLERMD